MSVESYSDSGEDIVKELAAANEFTDQDLAANRGGKISDNQFGKLAKKALRPLLTTGSTLVGWLFFCYCLNHFAPGIVRLYIMKKAGVSMIMVTAGAMGSFLLGLLQTSRLTFLLISDLKIGLASAMEGRISPSWEERTAQGLSRLYGGKEPVYHYCIKSEEFEVDEEGYTVLKNRMDGYSPMVKLYYAPKSRLLLSLEPRVSS